ncbi:HTH-type transcriptional regulator McbR [Pseudovibrio axinellae]|uniref:HTH-type transcriptional regulator McbR n=1 Tax=Pseudovibrio axinellae TaxID=989403 RepID=A0A165Z590_9HYPH|nr:GntR family transcriptional regulator [Pseudovibrio axinellae]KZL19521.1 HTH-type transcriptional regulator McbR [Pseudovibrio axinellae]SEQ30280.1 transcriptional regulator, GntR family [Pseudovibrio axinellae]
MLHSNSDRSLISRFGISPWSTSSNRKSDAVYNYLEEQIIVGALKPGDAIAEQQVADACDCAQGTVREALFKLQQSGLVVRHDYKGTRIAGISHAEAVEIVKIRMQLEEQAGRMIASKISSTVRDRLFEILDAMCQAADDNEIFLCSAYDRLFHATLFSQANLKGLEPILERCALHMHRVTLSHRDIPLDGSSIHEKHITIIESHCKGSPEEAARAAREHVSFLFDRWMSEHTFRELSV